MTAASKASCWTGAAKESEGLATDPLALASPAHVTKLATWVAICSVAKAAGYLAGVILASSTGCGTTPHGTSWGRKRAGRHTALG